MIITRQRLAEIIDDELAQVLSETRPQWKKGETYSQYKKRTEKARKLRQSKPRKQTPAQLMKKITDAMATLGCKVGSRERNPGSIKAWVKDPSQVVTHEKVEDVLKSAGLKASIWRSNYDPDNARVEGPGFKVTTVREGDTSWPGIHWFVQVFLAGVRGEEEEMGIDTTDLGEMDEMSTELDEADYAEPLEEGDNGVVADIAKKVSMALYRELVSTFSPEHLQPGTLQTMRSKLEQVVRHMVSELV